MNMQFVQGIEGRDNDKNAKLTLGTVAIKGKLV